MNEAKLAKVFMKFSDALNEELYTLRKEENWHAATALLSVKSAVLDTVKYIANQKD
ncbi:MAG: hypothetical protein PVG39_02510 [Desulfobacteraceae bacterium]|jgi:hypothetical protein